MYPLHKYLPTPFGTYLLYIDNGPTRVQVNKDLPQLPSYQTVKDYGKKLHPHHQPTSKYQAFSKPAETSKRPQAKPATAPTIQHQRKKDTFTPSSTMPNSIWSPKVKRMHLSYNMRQLWHTGQPMKDPPSKVIEVDALTGAELKYDAKWYKGRASNEHEGMNITPSSYLSPGQARHRSADSFNKEKVSIPLANSIPTEKSRRPKVPPNTVTNSPVLSEAYKRQASQLGRNMIPKRHKRSSHSSKRQLYNERRLVPQVNRETQTTPFRFAKSSMDYSEVSVSPSTRGRASERSTSVPLGSSNTSRTKECMEMTGLPPILETEAPVTLHEPQTIRQVPVTVESNGWEQRNRCVQEFRSSPPTFPLPSNESYWEEMNKRKYTCLPASHNLLPFTWKEPKRFKNDEGQLQQRKSEVDKILPMISRMPTVPRL